MKTQVVLAIMLCSIGLLAGRLCLADTWTDRFEYPSGSAGEPAWEAGSVAWSVEDGSMKFDGGGKSFLVLQKLGLGRRVTVEATLQVTGRRADGWAIAGVALHFGEPNHWHLAMIEAPKADGGARTVELTESYEGRWLANYNGETALRNTANVGSEWRWEYNHPYRLRLTVAPAGIEGTVSELDGAVQRRIGWAFDQGKPAVRAGAPALDAALFTGFISEVRAEVTDMVAAPEAEKTESPPYSAPGCEEVRGAKTGFFHAEKQGGTWWLIDPNGLGFFAVGVDHVNYNAHWCQKLGYAPYHRNVEQKYGNEDKWAQTTAERLRQWGFNTVGAGHSESLRHTSFAHAEWFAAGTSFAEIEDIVPRTTWTGFPNVFSPKWRRHCEALARRICAPSRDDPYLLGYFLDNELQWFGDLGNWQNDSGLFTETWKKPAGHSAKQAWMEVVRKRCPDIAAFNRAFGSDYVSFEALAASTQPHPAATDEAKQMARDYVRLAAELYFKESTDAIRRHDPNHMVLGCRFAGWAPDIWDIAGRYCDVVTFNTYPRIDVDRGVPADLVAEYRDHYEKAGRPLMVTEWSFPALDSGLPCQHGAGMRVATQAQKARCFAFFQSTLFGLPFMVGSDYFMYIDEPALGISDTFPEDSNYGLVNERDEPWAELTQAAAKVNAHVCELHRTGKLEAVFQPPPAAGRARALPPVAGTPPALPLTLRTGPLELTSATGGDGWVMKYGGIALGVYHPLIHQQAPSDLWTRPDETAVTAVREDAEFTVVDMTFARKGGGAAITQFDPATGQRAPQQDAPPAFRTAYRFWIPKQSCGWFGAQSLWVESADARPWRLASIFHYTRPAIGGSAEGDEPAKVNVPDFYLPVGAWEDRAAGLGQAVFGLGEGLRILYWKDKDGFHSDCSQAVGVELKPGERYAAEGPIAIHFGYPAHADADLLKQLEQVRREAVALSSAK
jgi:agarase